MSQKIDLSQVTIRKANANDMAAVHALICELAEYEHALDQVQTSAEQMRESGFGKQPQFEVIVAESSNKEIIGMALFFEAYSTWKGKMVYLDDLVVTQRLRHEGIGSKLFLELIKIAEEKGAQLIKWAVLDWNEPAIAFYKKLHAKFDNEWMECKIYHNDFQNSIKQLDSR